MERIGQLEKEIMSCFFYVYLKNIIHSKTIVPEHNNSCPFSTLSGVITTGGEVQGVCQWLDILGGTNENTAKTHQGE